MIYLQKGIIMRRVMKERIFIIVVICIGVFVVISGILAVCNLVLAQKVSDEVSEEEALAGLKTPEEVREMIKSAIPPSPIPIPKDILEIMNEAQIKVDFLKKHIELLKSQIIATDIQIKWWEVAKNTEYWFYLADNGVKKKDYGKWYLKDGVARYRK